MKVLIDGNIPRSAGLSSSSALVVCAALTTALANQLQINTVCRSLSPRRTVTMFSLSQNELAELCAECEKYIGTQGGKTSRRRLDSNSAFSLLSKVEWIRRPRVWRVADRCVLLLFRRKIRS